MARWKVQVSDDIKAVHKEYFGEDMKEPLARRDGDGFVALLFPDTAEVPGLGFFAVCFNIRLNDGKYVWEITEDGIEFESVKEFKDEKLVQSLLF